MAGALLCAEEIIPQIREEFQTPPDFSRILCKKPGRHIMRTISFFSRAMIRFSSREI